MDQPPLTEDQLAQALERIFGITAGHAAEIAAAHRRGELPADAEKIRSDVDLESFWGRLRSS